MTCGAQDEPHGPRRTDLEFHHAARHTDPRHGIINYGPADVEDGTARTIRVGVVGTAASIDGLRRWLDRCRQPVAAKDSRLTKFYVPFPGFDTTTGFRSTLVFNSRLERVIRERDLIALNGLKPEIAVRRAVELYRAELELLDEEPGCDVVLIARPDDLRDRIVAEADPSRRWARARPSPATDFRAMLKGESMSFSRPLQLIRRSTWDPKFRPSNGDVRGTQDEATRAWNLHTALYYKAGGVPWRLPRDPGALTSCYVGVTFYKSTDGASLQTSVAQVFNQRGDGVIIRGAPARESRHDRQPHLTRQDAHALLAEALQRYRGEHRTLPARLVMHKTSSYTLDELAGFHVAADENGLDSLELLWLPSSEDVRLFRTGQHPPLRGTLLSLGSDHHLLYTRGSVPAYGTYPGMYIPSPLPFRTVETESSAASLAAEILALTKMNWNHTQLDGRQPITMRTADNVGDILKHVPDAARPQARYARFTCNRPAPATGRLRETPAAVLVMRSAPAVRYRKRVHRRSISCE